MSLKETIASDFKEAFKSKELEKKEVLSLLQSEIKNKEIELGKREEGLGDDEVIGVISRAVKQRKDSIQQYQDAGRTELAEKEQKEVEILSGYLPEQMGDEDVEKEVAAIIEKTGATSPADMGKVMGAAMSSLKGKVDGGKVKEVAQRLLQKQK